MDTDGDGLADEVGTAVLDCVRETRPPFSHERVVEAFVGTLRAYGCSEVVGDRFGGEWCREPFARRGVRYPLSEKARSDLYRDTLPLLTSGRAVLLDLPRLASQFTALERRSGRGGRDTIDHGPGGHDDLANAVAGALVAVSGAGVPGFLLYIREEMAALHETQRRVEVARLMAGGRPLT